MTKQWTKREITFFGGNDSPTVEIKVAVYAQEQLAPEELKRLGDHLADNAMLNINGAPFVKAPLSRIQVKRNAK